jgi:hypothetical protein
VGFLFLSEKVKLLPLVRIPALRLVLLKASELLYDRGAVHILLPFLTKCFENVMIQRPASDKVDDFYGSLQNFFQGCWKRLCYKFMST